MKRGKGGRSVRKKRERGGSEMGVSQKRSRERRNEMKESAHCKKERRG